MEMRHAEDSWKHKKSGNSVAVNLEQFRNHEVGEGYQAKFVVRQQHKEASSSVVIKDMTKIQSDTSVRASSSELEKSRSSNRRRNAVDRDELLMKYLECEGLREFRKEVEKILEPN